MISIKINLNKLKYKSRPNVNYNLINFFNLNNPSPKYLIPKSII